MKLKGPREVFGQLCWN